jgi:His/Glu/Gln/Arg/opine family amino acid ABC transporter permease subunit
MKYLLSLDFSVVWQFAGQIALGLAMTLFLWLSSGMSGLVLGTLLAITGRSSNRLVRLLVDGYIEIWRNTPLLVQLFWVHFALPSLTGVTTTALQSGLLALTGNVTAYFAEIIRAGIQSVDRGQWDAARALGLHRYALWRTVILPQVIRIVLPPLTSLYISLLKATAILSVLSISELMRVITSLSNNTFRPVELLTSAAVLYSAAGLAVARLGTLLEKRMSVSGVRQ